jgi:signal transduction histidine kinase
MDDDAAMTASMMSHATALVGVVQQLSLASNLAEVMKIVRTAARQLTGADGVTFVLRDGDCSYYADEDAIGPLWKGQRFPMADCISGWAMLHREPAVIPDVYVDPRVPVDAYRPTFVKSLVMVPIRTLEPVGAIGTYWSRSHLASDDEVRLLSTLADFSSIALENVRLHEELERRVEERTADLLSEQRQKEEIVATIVHDLRSPANGIMLASTARLRHQLSPADRRSWQIVQTSAAAIHRMAMNMLDVIRSEDGTFAPCFAEVGVAGLVVDVADQLTPVAKANGQHLTVHTHEAPTTAICDGELVRRVLQNLIDNALQHAPPDGNVWLVARALGEQLEFRVADDGPGIPPEQRDVVFEKWSRLSHGEKRASTGRGLGLSFCRIAVASHGGTISIESREPHGCIFVVRMPIAGPPRP